jgi:predicted metalloprotease with PDZ domain
MTSPIVYKIQPLSLSEHIFSISINVPSNDCQSLHFSLPAWIPGSYMIRDFARNIHQISAKDENGAELSIVQTDKQSWEVINEGKAIQVDYLVYAFDLSVRGAYLFDEYAFFNGTSTFLEIKELRAVPISLFITNNQVENNWRIACSLSAVDEQAHGAHQVLEYCCEDYQELIDHPVLLGQFEQHTFQVDQTTFHLVLSGSTQTDIEKICLDLKPLCEHHMLMFDGFPGKEYWFITLLTEDGFGGLEHRASTALMYPRFHLPMKHEFQDTKDNNWRSPEYQRFLSLCSHELFHTWHVKRNKPEVMIEPDLSKEVYMEQLWIYEGFTSHYDDLSLARSKLISHERYAQILAENLTRLIRTQGRHLQTVTESSFNAWTKFYKQDAGSHNHIVSYYNKGAIVALLLDITLRDLSSGKYCLDDVMKILWRDYGANNIGTHDHIIHDICKVHFGVDISSFLDIAIYSTIDLPYSQMLSSIGLKLHYRSRSGLKDLGGTPADKVALIGFGASYQDKDSGIMIQSVQDGSPASKAGLQIGDILIAVDKWQVDSVKLQSILDSYAEEVNSLTEDKLVLMTYLRQGRLIQSELQLEPAILDTVYLSIEKPSIFEKWLN